MREHVDYVIQQSCDEFYASFITVPNEIFCVPFGQCKETLAFNLFSLQVIKAFRHLYSKTMEFFYV